MTETDDRPDLPTSQSSIQQLDTKLDILIEQVAKLTSVLTVGLSDLDAKLDRITEATERQAAVAERQALTIERQSLAIERLALMLERVLERG